MNSSNRTRRILETAVVVALLSGCSGHHPAPGGTSANGLSVAPAPGAPAYCSELAAIPGKVDIVATVAELSDPDKRAAAQSSLISVAAQLERIAGTGPASIAAQLRATAAATHAYARDGQTDRQVSDNMAKAWLELGTAVQAQCKFPLQ